MNPIIQKNRKAEIVKISNDDESAFVYLQKRYCLTVGDRQVVDQHQTERRKGLAIIQRLIKKIMQDKGVDRNTAREMIFPKVDDDGNAVQTPESEDLAFEYAEELEELGRISTGSVDFKALIATLFISSRSCYAIQLSESALLNSETLNVHPVNFPIPDKTIIGFSEPYFIQVKGNHDIGAIAITTNPIPRSLSSDEVGFLYTDKKKPITGVDWKEAESHVKDMPEDLLEAIYSFFERESQKLPEPSQNESPVGEQSPTGETSMLPAAESNGMNSTGEFNPTELQTPDLVATSNI